MAPTHHAFRSWIFRCAVIGCAIAALTIGVLAYRLGSVSLALAYMNGQNFAVQPTLIDFGECEGGACREARITVTSLCGRPIRIVGWENTCGCITTERFPIEVGPGASRELLLRLSLPPDENEEYLRTVILYIDDGYCRPLVTRLRARVVKANSG